MESRSVRLQVPWELARHDPGRLPLLVRVLAASGAIAIAGPFSVGGFRLSGWAWVLSLAVSSAVLAKHVRRVSFPWLLWAPWILLLLVGLALTSFHAVQRTLQVLSPIAVGFAVSTLRPDDALLARLARLARPAFLVLVGAMVVRSGLLLSGVVPDTTGFAPESMMVTLLAVLAAVQWHLGDAKASRWWFAAVATTLFTVTRTTMVATTVTLPLSLAHVRPSRRVAMALVVALLGLGIFSTERVQRKSFASGSGGIEDLMGQEFRDSGRFHMWRLFRDRIAERPWLGWGAGAGQAYAREITAGQLAYPHNDWLQNTMDFGYLGSGLYLLTMTIATLHALRAGRRGEGSARTFLLAGASAFPIFCILMYGDNAMTYGAFFGNYQFAMLGLGYAALAGRRERASSETREAGGTSRGAADAARPVPHLGFRAGRQ